MNLPSLAFNQQLSMRISVAAILSLAIFLMSYPCSSEAKSSFTTSGMKLLGNFAWGVVEAFINSKENPSTSSQPQISGYIFTLMWQAQDGVYSGMIVMQGKEGIFRVNTPQGTSIDQDMIAYAYKKDVWLVGSNPRYSGSFNNAAYSPDSFRLTQSSNRRWSIGAMCDNQGLCASVRVIEARAF